MSTGEVEQNLTIEKAKVTLRETSQTQNPVTLNPTILKTHTKCDLKIQ